MGCLPFFRMKGHIPGSFYLVKKWATYEKEGNTEATF